MAANIETRSQAKFGTAIQPTSGQLPQEGL